MINAQRKEAGFSLLEVLVAFSILALCLGVLMQIFSGGLRNAMVSGNYSQSVDLAESVLARLDADLFLTSGAQGGTESKFNWNIEAAPYPLDGLVAPPQNTNLYLVVARVSWSDSSGTHQVTLHTLRIILQQQ